MRRVPDHLAYPDWHTFRQHAPNPPNGRHLQDIDTACNQLHHLLNRALWKLHTLENYRSDAA